MRFNFFLPIFFKFVPTKKASIKKEKIKEKLIPHENNSVNIILKNKKITKQNNFLYKTKNKKKTKVKKINGSISVLKIFKELSGNFWNLKLGEMRVKFEMKI